MAIDEANFPDGYFRFYVSDWFDFDGNGILDAEEIASVKKVEFRYGDGSEKWELFPFFALFSRKTPPFP